MLPGFRHLDLEQPCCWGALWAWQTQPQQGEPDLLVHLWSCSPGRARGGGAPVPLQGAALRSCCCSCSAGQRFWVYQGAKVLGPRSTEKLGIGRDVPKLVGALPRKQGKVLLFSGEQFWRYGVNLGWGRAGWWCMPLTTHTHDPGL